MNIVLKLNSYIEPDLPMNSAEATHFLALMKPLQIGHHQLRNRLVMGSMHTRLEHLDNAMQREAAFYGARAAGGVGMIVTGGFSPNNEGLLEPGGPLLSTAAHAHNLKPIVRAVHQHGAKFLLQVLHAGRYAKHSNIVGAGPNKSSINPRTPRAMTNDDIERTLGDFVRCAELARDAGFDGVELMGSEGYLVNQFTVPRTNTRDDDWGGSLENRCRFPVELVRRTRERLGSDFLIMYRISAIDLVGGGLTAGEIDELARRIEQAGADILNTGYGWHEAPVPTIAYQVPRAAWAFGAARLKGVVTIPVMASNRINTPEMADRIVASGMADLISMARPMLADPEFAKKAAAGRADEINTCIACNQSCLDYIFTERTATCLVNPRACREIDFEAKPACITKRIAVVGSGPAGLSAAVEASRRGHQVTLYEADAELGGQLNLARRIPGKQEFNELLRYFRRQLEISGVMVRLGEQVDAERLRSEGWEHVIVATGVWPRRPDIPGILHPMVVGYKDVIQGRAQMGGRVVVIGAGGIAHDVAELLSHLGAEQTPEGFYAEWGVDPEIRSDGGNKVPAQTTQVRQITLLQRSEGRVGERLGKSTGWIVRNRLRQRGVSTLSGVTYRRIDDRGLHVTRNGKDEIVAADTIVICAGQESACGLAADLRAQGLPFDVIGGARLAGELDAARAIDEGTQLGIRI